MAPVIDEAIDPAGEPQENGGAMISSVRIRIFIAVLTGAAMVSCSGHDVVTAPQHLSAPSGGPNRFIVWGDGWCNSVDGGFTDDQCDQLSGAIQMLMGSTNSQCAQFAGDAWAMFNSGEFVPSGGDPEYNMYVYMEANSSSSSGWSYDGTGVRVEESIFGHGQGEMAGLIAHEMVHVYGLDGPSHNTGLANQWQDTCLNSL